MNDRLKKVVQNASPDELVDMIFKSPVSGLLNRKAIPYADPVQMYAIVDMDGLKWLNDYWGHEEGDRQIRELGILLEEDFPGRAYHLSGDEFVILAHTRGQANSLVYSLFDLQEECQRRMSSTFSFGVGMTLAKADEAMQHDKTMRLAGGLRAERGQALENIS
jgi:GGDEF domain-containing protein